MQVEINFIQKLNDRDVHDEFNRSCFCAWMTLKQISFCHYIVRQQGKGTLSLSYVSYTFRQAQTVMSLDV